MTVDLGLLSISWWQVLKACAGIETAIHATIASFDFDDTEARCQ